MPRAIDHSASRHPRVDMRAARLVYLSIITGRSFEGVALLQRNVITLAIYRQYNDSYSPCGEVQTTPYLSLRTAAPHAKREGFVGSVATAHRAMSGMQIQSGAKLESFLCKEKQVLG